MFLTPPLSGRPLILWRWLFSAALAGAFVVAVSPVAMQSGESQADKAAHFFAFYGLSLMAALAFPRTSLIVVGVAMSAYGALIEVAQGLDIIGRDRDAWDWAADTLGCIAALTPLALAPWRKRP